MMNLRVTALLFALCAGGPAAACEKPADAAGVENEVIALINAERVRQGLDKVRRSAVLEKAADRQACDLATHGRLSHTGSDGSSMRDRVKGAGYPMRFANENIGMGFRSPQSAVAWWMNSPGHRANLLEPRVRDIGVSVTTSGKVFWVTVMGESR
ncbi:MAG: CAP domain-containing protein [Paracoccaceae bacterium]